MVTPDGTPDPVTEAAYRALAPRPMVPNPGMAARRIPRPSPGHATAHQAEPPATQERDVRGVQRVTLHRLCPTCGTPMAARTKGRCTSCERQRSRDRRASSHATQTRNTSQWQRIRTAARARDRGCTHGHHGDCHGRLEVHHIVPLEHGGSNDLSNLVTLCRAHHEQAEALF